MRITRQRKMGKKENSSRTWKRSILKLVIQLTYNFTQKVIRLTNSNTSVYNCRKYLQILYNCNEKVLPFISPVYMKSESARSLYFS